MISPQTIIDISLYGICLTFLSFELYIVFRYMVFPIPKLETQRNPNIRKCDFVKTDKKLDKEKYNEELKEYKLIKQIDRVPSKFARITCIILSEGHTAKILFMPFFKESFRYCGCLYFITNSHSCENNAKILVYLEGISLPVSCENIEKETVKRTYIDVDGTTKTSDVTVIKGIKYDGKILDNFSNREFAKNFNAEDTNVAMLLLIILLVVTLIVSCIGICASYIFR